MTEFEHLRMMVAPSSTCDKRAVAAGCYVGEKFVTAANHCENTGHICNRMELGSGDQPDLCQSIHAEIGLLNTLTSMNIDIIPTIAWIYGHYYAWKVLENGIYETEIRIRQY